MDFHKAWGAGKLWTTEVSIRFWKVRVSVSGNNTVAYALH